MALSSLSNLSTLLLFLLLKIQATPKARTSDKKREEMPTMRRIRPVGEVGVRWEGEEVGEAERRRREVGVEAFRQTEWSQMKWEEEEGEKGRTGGVDEDQG